MKAKNIVFVHGLFGWGKNELMGVPYWGRALDADIVDPNGLDDLVVHEASCGPVSSFHDRACEVFAQIKGVPVDYGKPHSIQEGHLQYSKDYTGKGFVNDWSSENPLVLVGHSAGAHTCLRLQQLLEEDFWGLGSSADWVEAIVCISGVLNGSTLPYMLGCDKQTGKLTGPVGNFLGNAVQFISIAGGSKVKDIYDFDLEHWVGNASKADFPTMVQALENSRYAKGTDNLAYDLSLQGCKEANGRVKTYPNTYYLSIVTEQTTKGWFTSHFYPDLGMNPLLAASATYQGLIVDFDSPPISGWGFGDLNIDHWRENDGAVSSISQRYPFTAGQHPVGGKGLLNNPNIKKGHWYYEKAEEITGKSFDHLDPGIGYLSEPGMQVPHEQLYIKLYQLLRKL